MVQHAAQGCCPRLRTPERCLRPTYDWGATASSNSCRVTNLGSRSMVASYLSVRRKSTSAIDLAHRAIWQNMLQRCNNPRNPGYHNYGGRGVTVCDRWDPAKGGSFHNFLQDMGYRPSVFHQLDKEAVSRHNLIYGPEYCRWVPRAENQASDRKRARNPKHSS